MAIDILMGMRVFTKVVDLMSFAKAADSLNLSRGMTSRYVAQLEEHLAVRLLHRTTRHLALTDAGQAYYQKASQILALVAQAEQTAITQNQEPLGTLRLTCAVAFGGTLLGEAIADYLMLYPQMKVCTTLCERMVDLVEEGFDVAIRLGEIMSPGLVSRTLGEIRMIVGASPKYVARHGTPLRPEELIHHACLTFANTEGPQQWNFTRKGREHSVRVQGPLHGNNSNILCRAATQGLGIVYQPAFMLQQLIDSGQLLQLLPDWETETSRVVAVYPDRLYLPLKVRSFIDFLVERFYSHPHWLGGI